MNYKKLYRKYKQEIENLDNRIEYVVGLRRSLWDQKDSIEFQCANFRVFELYKEKKDLIEKSMCVVAEMPMKDLLSL